MWVVIGVALALILLWVAVLDAELRRLRAEQGDPVYRRLPNGRLQFKWEVARQYEATRYAVEHGPGAHRAADRAGAAPGADAALPAVTSPELPPRAGHHASARRPPSDDDGAASLPDW